MMCLLEILIDYHRGELLRSWMVKLSKEILTNHFGKKTIICQLGLLAIAMYTAKYLSRHLRGTCGESIHSDLLL